MADVHVTLHVSDQVTVTVIYTDTDTVTLQGGSTVTAANLVVGHVLADGRQVTALHTVA